MPNRERTRRLAHPGDSWRKIMEDGGFTQVDISRTMGISSKHLNLIVNGHSVPTCQRTVSFARATGNDPRVLWQQVADFMLQEAMRHM